MSYVFTLSSFIDSSSSPSISARRFVEPSEVASLGLGGACIYSALVPVLNCRGP